MKIKHNVNISDAYYILEYGLPWQSVEMLDLAVQLFKLSVDALWNIILSLFMNYAAQCQHLVRIPLYTHSWTGKDAGIVFGCE